MDFSSIGKRIQEKRKSLDIMQSQLAEMVEVSENYLSKIERGKKTPSIQCFVKIVNALGVTSDEILYDVIDKSYVSRTSSYIEHIGNLPLNERNRFYGIMDLLLGKSEND